MKIDGYSFGSMTINGKVYKNDVIILPEKIVPDWWRKEGHNLFLEDLAFLDEFTPETLVVGCGYYGIMKTSDEVREYCADKGINLIVEKSATAVQTYNRIAGSPDVAGAFHLP